MKILFISTVTILIFYLSEDFNLKHIANIDSKEVNFRNGLSRTEVNHYYPRWDTKSPADFINQRLKKNETVIINEQVYEYYLNRIDYLYYNYSNQKPVGTYYDLNNNIKFLKSIQGKNKISCNCRASFNCCSYSFCLWRRGRRQYYSRRRSQRDRKVHRACSGPARTR